MRPRERKGPRTGSSFTRSSIKKLPEADASFTSSKLEAPTAAPRDDKDEALQRWRASEDMDNLLEENVLGDDRNDAGRRGLSSVYASQSLILSMDFPSVAKDKGHRCVHCSKGCVHCSKNGVFHKYDNRRTCGIIGHIIGTPRTNPRFRMVSHFSFRRLKQGYRCFFKGTSAACGNPILWHFPMRSAASLAALWHSGLTPSEFARHLLFIVEAGLNILPHLKLEFGKGDVGIARSKINHGYNRTRQILAVVDVEGRLGGGAADSFGHHGSAAALDVDGDVVLELGLPMSGEALDTARLLYEVLDEHYAGRCEAVLIVNVPESPLSLNPQRGRPRFSGTAWWDLLQQCNVKAPYRCHGEAGNVTTFAAAGAAALWRKGGLRVLPVSIKLFGNDYANDPDFLEHADATSLLKKPVRPRLSTSASTSTAAVTSEAIISIGPNDERAIDAFMDSDEELALWGWLVDEQQLISFALDNGGDALVRSPMVGSSESLAALFVSEHEHKMTSYRDLWKVPSLVSDNEKGDRGTLNIVPSCTVLEAENGAGTTKLQTRYGDYGKSRNAIEKDYAVALADGNGREQLPLVVQGWLSVRSGPPVYASSDWKSKFAMVDAVRGELLLLPLKEDFDGNAETARALVEALLPTAIPKSERGGEDSQRPHILQRLLVDDIGSVSFADELNRRCVPRRESLSLPGPFFKFYYQGDLWELQVKEHPTASDDTGAEPAQRQPLSSLQSTPPMCPSAFSADICLNSATWVQALECRAADHKIDGDFLRQKRLQSSATLTRSQLQNDEVENNHDENNEDSNRESVHIWSDGGSGSDSLDDGGDKDDGGWSTANGLCRDKKAEATGDSWKPPALLNEEGLCHLMDLFPPPVPVRYPYAEVIEVKVPLSPNDNKTSPFPSTQLPSLASCDDCQGGATTVQLENWSRRSRRSYGGVHTAVEEALGASIERPPCTNLRMRSSPGVLTRGGHSVPCSVSESSFPTSSNSGNLAVSTDITERSSSGPIYLCGIVFCRRCYLRGGEELVVVSVSKGCAAYFAGLQAGDVVLGIDGTPNSVPGGLERRIRNIAFHFPPPVFVAAPISLSGVMSSPITSSSPSVDSQARLQDPLPDAPSINGIFISSAARTPPSSSARKGSAPKELPPSPLPPQRGARRLPSLNSSRDGGCSMVSPSACSSTRSTVSRPPLPRTVDGDRIFRGRSSNSNPPQASFERGCCGILVAGWERSQSGSSNRIRCHRSQSSPTAMPTTPPPTIIRLKIWRFKRLNGPSANLDDGHIEFAGLQCSGGDETQKATGTARQWYREHQELAMRTGQHVCVSIDAETRGMHVQQTGKTGPITIVSAVGDAAVRGMRCGDVLVGVQHSPLPMAATLAHVQELMEAIPRPLALNLYRPSTWEAHEKGFAVPPSNFKGGERDAELAAMAPNSMSAQDFGGWWDEKGPSLQIASSPSPSAASSTHRCYRNSAAHICDLSAPFKRMPQGNCEVVHAGDDGSEEAEDDAVASFLSSVGVRQRRYWLSEFHHSDDPGTPQCDPGNGGVVHY